MLLHAIIYALSFIGIWVGAGLAIGAVEKLSHRLQLSSFIVSFLVLGFFTSISELSVGVNAVLSDDPGIFVGNLIGASIVIFLMVIPLLAITGKAIAVNKEVRGKNLLFPLLVVSLPVLLSLDGSVSRFDGMVAIILYVLSAFFMERYERFSKNIPTQLVQFSTLAELGKIVGGALLIFGSSHMVVDQTVYFSTIFGLSQFFISLMIIGIGTNLPELSLVIRSVGRKSNQVAFGDYLGSATFNTFIFGILSLWYDKQIFLSNSYVISLGFLIVGLFMFYHFAKTKHTISKSEAWVLFGVYLIFFCTEILLHIPRA